MSEAFPRIDVSVDVVPITLHEGSLHVLLTTREAEPFRGRPALAGGYVHPQSDGSAGDTAKRIMRDRLGLDGHHVEQLSTFSGPDRDPRGWSLSVAYFSVTPVAALDAALARDGTMLVPATSVSGLPFDHDLIVSAAVARLRAKGAYSDLPARLLPREFTMRELHHVYSAVAGESLNKDAFRRKVLERGILEPAGTRAPSAEASRPASLWRIRSDSTPFDRPIR